MTLRQAPWAPTALAAVVVLALPGCGAAAAAQPVVAEPIVFATGKDISCLDPHVNGDMTQASLAANYLDSLVSQDKDGKIHPWLAESWEVSADGLSYTFTVRDD